MTIEATAKKWHVSSASLSRHRLSHLDRGIRRPEPIDATRTAADVLVTLADRLADLDAIAVHEMAGGNSGAAIRAANESRQLSKLLLRDLELDSTATARWLRDLETFTGATYRWAREQPGVLSAVADHVRDNDEMARELRSSQTEFDTARTTKENAVA